MNKLLGPGCNAWHRCVLANGRVRWAIGGAQQQPQAPLGPTRRRKSTITTLKKPVPPQPAQKPCPFSELEARIAADAQHLQKAGSAQFEHRATFLRHCLGAPDRYRCLGPARNVAEAENWLKTYDRHEADREEYKALKLKLWLLSTTPDGAWPGFTPRLTLPWEIRALVSSAVDESDDTGQVTVTW